MGGLPLATPLSGGRHRRRIRIALPVAAAGVAAAVAAVLTVSSAGAATASADPTAKLSKSSASLTDLTDRIAGALATDKDFRKASKTKDTKTGGPSTSSTSSTSSGSSSTSTVSPMVIGGTTTSITSAPWMAQLWYYDDKGTSDTGDDVGFFCGGAVVAPTKILTAAHCVHGYNWHAYGSIVTGTDQLPTTDSSGNTDLHGGTVSGVWRQWNHPSYNSTTVDNDVAVLTLATPITATPIRMTTSTDTASYAAGTGAKVYGWGRTSSTSNDISGTLQSATLPIQSDSTCSGYYNSEFIAGHMVCAGNPATGSDSGTVSACNGDSGGPLIVGNRIVGIVSWGVQDCVAKGAYSVFTKVRSYVGAAYPRIDDTNLSDGATSTPDGKADLFVRDHSTYTGYEKDSKGTSFAARVSWGSFSGYNTILQTDLNRDGYQDFILRRSSDGAVFWLHYIPSTQSWSKSEIFSNWASRKFTVAPGDVTGDYLPDLLSVDSSGILWIYPGKGNGTFASRVEVGSGWGQYSALRGHGDFNGDGKTDLIAWSKSTGYVYLYRGTGTAGSGAFSSRINVRTWTGYNTFDAVGDVTGDGKADFLARTSSGTLYLYPGTGKATSEIFATRISVGTGFQGYDLFG
ncbi:trypsin-like serine protease [Streptomyces guryensis]|uniref:Trypsin-like serine protease n=1 Tax=Streptomyces guryensis TaxID=2886947 RepID=A0A9Q3VW64_9ACTN|nr:trypsin-like serine protease [Streptomyces guryensis]MCD9878080.1 trypsin-like serine protease [Streptomyces guryensis]